MKRKITLTLAAVLCVVATVTLAQLPVQEPVSTTPPPAARYELIQNSRAMNETYLLDRYSGNSWQLVQSTKRYVWQRIPKEPHDEDIVPKEWWALHTRFPFLAWLRRAPT